jgi:DNA-binding GntR family transcriptional regulator
MTSQPFDPTSDPTRYVYEQLADHLAQRIESGELPANKPIPAEGRLAQEYGVGLSTARHAVRLLVFRGLVKKVRSKGTYVLPSQPNPYLNDGK